MGRLKFTFLVLIFGFVIPRCMNEAYDSNHKIFDSFVKRTVSISIENEILLGKKRWIGSGFFISKDGFIITCAHVLGDIKKKFVIRLGGSGKRYLAKLIVTDPNKDIALIALETEDEFDFFEIKPNIKTIRGQMYYSISTPLGLEDSFSSGIVSDPERIGADSLFSDLSYLQVNQSVLPGSSGSAIFDSSGNLLGMAQFQVKNSEYNQQGVGFAILPKYIYEFIKSNHLSKYSKTEMSRGIVEVPTITNYLVQNLKLPTNDGVLISYVVDNSPADLAGLKRYDLIIAINGKRIRNAEELTDFFSKTSISERLQINLIRNRSEKEIFINP